jgi:hypothetical protein
VWFDLFDRFPIEGDDQMQNTMRGGMLRTYIDHQIPLFRRAYFFDHSFNFVASPAQS